MSHPADPSLGIRRTPTRDLIASEIAALRDLLWAAFPPDYPSGGFTEHDWQHALGGVHFVLRLDPEIVGHAAVVERELRLGEVAVRAGYVESVAVLPGLQRGGLGTLLMRDVDEYIAERFELGALGTGVNGFYERLGWRTWRGPSFVAGADGVRRPTPDDDGSIMVLATPHSPPLDLDAPIACPWRPGDVW